MGIACTEPALDPSAKSQSCTESRKIPRQELCTAAGSGEAIRGAAGAHIAEPASKPVPFRKPYEFEGVVGPGKVTFGAASALRPHLLLSAEQFVSWAS